MLHTYKTLHCTVQKWGVESKDCKLHFDMIQVTHVTLVQATLVFIHLHTFRTLENPVQTTHKELELTQMNHVSFAWLNSLYAYHIISRLKCVNDKHGFMYIKWYILHPHFGGSPFIWPCTVVYHTIVCVNTWITKMCW